MYSSTMDYYRATSVSDAIKVLEKNKGAKLLAGGHSLIPAMKLRVANPPMLVDIGHIKSLSGIKVSQEGSEDRRANHARDGRCLSGTQGSRARSWQKPRR